MQALLGAIPGGAGLASGAGLWAQIGPALDHLSAGMFGAQLGQAVGTLAGDVLSGTEVGLPLMDSGAVALLPEQVSEFARGLEVDEGQVRLYLAVREAARVRLFAEVPLLAAQLEAAVRDYGRNVAIDTDAIEEAVRSVELTDLSNLSAMPEQPEVRTPSFRPMPEPRLARKFLMWVAARSDRVTAMVKLLAYAVTGGWQAVYSSLPAMFPCFCL